MFGQVVWYAMGGHRGLLALDLLMLVFLLGILVAYINAISGFLWETPFSTRSHVLDALLLVAIMGPLSSVPHMGYLSRASALGLIVLAMTFTVISIYGLLEQQQQQQQQQQQSTLWQSLRWTPLHGLWGISQWFGSVVFSFGITPLTYNFRSSMANPDQMVSAAAYSLTAVALAYIVLGICFWALFPTTLNGDLLTVLPTREDATNNGALWWTTLTRLAMVLVGLTTVPLLVVPCGELVEGKLLPTSSLHEHPKRRIVFRCGICLFAVGISLYVPGFVDVLSFVGCCCVACLGFCIPPLLHVLLAWTHRPPTTAKSAAMLLLDCLMLAWGVFATVVSTTYTFRQVSTATGVVIGK
jgi:amino acid permease